jgi:N utilization substance protein A
VPELRGERIDIIQFSDDLVTYAQNALSPAKITRVSVMPGDEEEEPEFGPDGEPLEPIPTLECIVEEDQLSLAIGKRGQNVRLAAALIGAKIEIKSEQAVKAEVADALQRMLLSSQRRGTALAEVPGVEETAATAFAEQGIHTVGELLDAAGGGEELAAAFAAVGLPAAERDAAIEMTRDFEEAPAPEPEPEPEEGDEELEAAGEAEDESPEERDAASAPAAPVTETPEK